MTYILLDLEWNSAYSRQNGKFINEIVQIGAVKLDSKLNTVDDISIMVKSQLTKRLSNRFKELTGITNEQMLSGVSLNQAVLQYNEWAGDDIVTLTWSTSDLFAVLENCRTFTDGLMLKLGRYVDLQGFVQDYLHRNGFVFNGQLSLKTAAEMMKLDIDGLLLHTAHDDSVLSAMLLRESFNEERLLKGAKDVENPEFFKRLLFKPYPITSINDSAIDKETLRFRCGKCGGYATRKSKWNYKNRWFNAEFKCRGCGNRFVGKLSFKKHYDCVVTKRVIVPKVNGEKNGTLSRLPETV